MSQKKKASTEMGTDDNTGKTGEQNGEVEGSRERWLK